MFRVYIRFQPKYIPTWCNFINFCRFNKHSLKVNWDILIIKTYDADVPVYAVFVWNWSLVVHHIYFLMGNFLYKPGLYYGRQTWDPGIIPISSNSFRYLFLWLFYDSRRRVSCVIFLVLFDISSWKDLARHDFKPFSLFR